ncbi:MAG: T9SS type A sorting domain-containing protein [Saprospiraceae bacterium]|nr:T9SS type A sorting domain-containing protein [Saprospiraceae bacterium]
MQHRTKCGFIVSKVICVFLTLSCHLTLGGQSCLPNGIIFTSQSQLNTFAIENQGCFEILGDVLIRGNDITNLDPLNTIQSIKGNLRINDNPKLTNLNGLNTLKSIGGFLTVFNNSILISISDLNNLEYVDKGVSFSANNNLISLSGLENIKKTTSLSIVTCHKISDLTPLQGMDSLGILSLNDTYLDNLNGLNNLHHINQIEINGNSKLKSIASLNSIESITDYIRIKDNPELESISGLNNLKRVSNFVSIVNNSKLVDFTGLENLSEVKDLLIGFNSNLKNFNGLSSLTNIKGLFILNNNKTLKNLVGLEKLKSIESEFRITENDSIVNLIGCTELKSIGSVSISKNPILNSCEGMQNLTDVKTSLNIGENPKLQSCSEFNSLRRIEEGFVNIYKNPSLTHLDGFPLLEYIGGKLEITNNSKLASISGFNNLKEVSFGLVPPETKYISISNNQKLISINGFQNLTKCNSLNIDANNSLNVINGFYQLHKVSELSLSGNSELEEIQSFINVTSGLKKIWISNQSLISITGLRNIKADSIEYLYIRGNSNLKACNLKFICDFVQNHNQPDYYLSFNGDNCNLGNDLPFTKINEYPAKNNLICIPYICNNSSLNVNLEGSTCINGSMTIRAEVTGTAPINFNWHNGTKEDSLIFKVNSTNHITLITEDKEGCNNYIDTSFMGYDIETPSIEITKETCYQCNDAAISVQSNNLESEILWADGDTLFNKVNLKPGIYSFTLYNSYGCRFDTTLVIASFECPSLFLDAQIENAKCFNLPGQINLVFENINNIDVIKWNDGTYGNTLTGVAGIYVAEIKTTNHCTYTDSFTIQQPEELIHNMYQQDPICFGDCTGKLTINLSGGIPPYITFLNDSIFIDSIKGLCAGEMLLEGFDQNGCTFDTLLYFNEGQPSPITLAGDTLFCFGSNTKISVEEDYDAFLWSNDETTKEIFISKQGDYEVTISNGNCKSSKMFSIYENPQIFGSLEYKNDTLFAIIEGGSPPYTFQWSDGSFNPYLITTQDGFYSVEVGDAQNCIIQKSINLSINSLKDHAATTLFAHPNPVLDIIYLFSSLDDKIQIIDLLGNILVQTNIHQGSNELQLIDLVPGMYYLKTTKGQTLKIIKI